jgi:hypothetical protein
MIWVVLAILIGALIMRLLQKQGQIGMFVAIRDSGTNRIMTSIDGINWNLRTTPATEKSWADITWSPQLGEFLAISYDWDPDDDPPETNQNRIMYSPDGVTWNLRDPALDTKRFYTVKWVDALGLYVLGGIWAYMTSPDGINWTSRIIDDGSAWLYSFAWSPEIEKLCTIKAQYSGVSYVSSDGINWTVGTDASANAAYLSLTWSPELGLFLGVNNNSTSVAYSSDGLNWTLSTPGLSIRYNGACWSPELGIFCIVSDDNDETTMGATSPDGANWTLRTLPSGHGWHRVCWSSELSLFVATASGAFATSPDGVTWTERAIPSTGDWHDIIWVP